MRSTSYFLKKTSVRRGGLWRLEVKYFTAEVLLKSFPLIWTKVLDHIEPPAMPLLSCETGKVPSRLALSVDPDPGSLVVLREGDGRKVMRSEALPDESVAGEGRKRKVAPSPPPRPCAATGMRQPRLFATPLPSTPRESGGIHGATTQRRRVQRKTRARERQRTSAAACAHAAA